MFPWMAVAQAGVGLFQTIKSSEAASNLPDYQKYTVSPELREAFNASKENKNRGWDPVEQRLFDQMTARNQTGIKRTFQNVGLSGAGAAAAGIMGAEATNEFMAQGSANKRAAFGQYAGLAGQLDSISQQETGRFNQQLNIDAKAFGDSTKAGISNMFGGFNSGVNTGQNNQAMDIYKGMGQGGQGGQGGGEFDMDNVPEWIKKMFMKKSQGGGDETGYLGSQYGYGFS